MVSGRSGGVPLTFRGGGVGVIAGGRRRGIWRGERGDEVVKSGHAGEHQRVATPVLSPRCLEEALGAFTVQYFVNILGCEFDWIGVCV